MECRRGLGKPLGQPNAAGFDRIKPLYNARLSRLRKIAMLNLYQSNRLEDLAAMMHKVQQSRPLPQALAAEEVMVQSQGMRRFIARYLAQQDGIAANIRFSLPASFAWRLMRDLLPGIPELSPFDTEVMRWRLLGLFVSDGLNAPH